MKEGVRTAGATPSEPPPLTRSGECVGARGQEGQEDQGQGHSLAQDMVAEAKSGMVTLSSRPRKSSV